MLFIVLLDSRISLLLCNKLTFNLINVTCIVACLLFSGYLEDQQCAEAAKHFLESSPHLQECRTVVSCGKRFSTKVNGLTLTDVIEKFSAISTMSKLSYSTCLLKILIITLLIK